MGTRTWQVRSLGVRHLLVAAFRFCVLRPRAALAVAVFQGLAWFVWHSPSRGLYPAWIPWTVAILLILYAFGTASMAAAWARQGHSVEISPLLRWSRRRFFPLLSCVALQLLSLAAVTASALALAWAGACISGYANPHRVPVLRRSALRQFVQHLPLHPDRLHLPTRYDLPFVALGILTCLWVFICVSLVVRWSLALDITLVEKVAPGRALGMSWRRTYGRGKQVFKLHGFFILLLLLLPLGFRQLGVEFFAFPLPYMGALFVGPLWAVTHSIYYAEVSLPALKLSRKEFQSAETFPGRY